MKLKIFTLALTLVTIATSSNAQQLRDNMIFNMPFNGDVNDFSGNEINGTIIDASPFTDRFGTGQSAYFFDGIDDNIELPHSASLKPELPMTFSMWVYREDSTADFNPLFTNDDHPSQYSGIMIQLHPSVNQAVAVSYGTGGGSGSQNRRTVFGSTPVEVQTWTHVAGVIRGPEDMDIYINGEKEIVTYSGTGGDLFYTDSPGRIGAFDGSNVNLIKHFKGALDDIKIWDSELTEEEIKSIFGELIWDMPINSDAIDISGNMIDGVPIDANLTEDRFGLAGGAYEFDGISSNIDIPSSPLFKPQLPFSVSYWVNINDIERASNVLFSNDDHPTFYSGISMRMNHQGLGTVSITYGSGVSSGSTNRRSAIGTTALESNKWYHIVGIIRGAQDMDIYINGVKDSVTYSGSGGPLFYSGMAGRVGSLDGSTFGDPQFFEGKLDEFKMWNRSISEDEIAALYTPGTISNVIDQEKKLDNKIQIFPNPASEFLEINLEGKTEFRNYQIFSTQGQLVQSGATEGMITIRSLSIGVYIIKLQSGENEIVQFFVKN